MELTAADAMEFIRDNDVKFIRLAFCDIFGTLKNCAVMADELPRAFADGFGFDASSVPGFASIDQSDMLLFPDPSTLALLPWRPQQGRVARFYCDIRYPDGRPFEGDGRRLLKKTVEMTREKGYTCRVGAECEFYLFETDERGNPTCRPQDEAGFMDVAPLDRGENVRREICLALEELGIAPVSSHHELGPGQNEVDFKYAEALETADNLITFKMAVKTIASLNGLHASFLPKPLPCQGGSGLHVNLSLLREGHNLFRSGREPAEHSSEAESFIAGILNRVKEMTAFLNPLTNSYRRFGAFEAPLYIAWSHQNRSELVRIPAASGENLRMELRSPDPTCNPYLAFSLLIAAGMEGIERNQPLSPASNFDLNAADESRLQELDSLPSSLIEALEAAKKSTFLPQVLPADTLAKYLRLKREEWQQYQQSQDKDTFESARYFGRF
ncbi:MAG: glutamine synthetase [Clostridiales bacterium]|jgi:glutamine synthetase|nr:glutamine synthetase [Clostridiales bacterium]